MQSYQGGYGKTPNFTPDHGCDAQFTRPEPEEWDRCDSCAERVPQTILYRSVDGEHTQDLCPICFKQWRDEETEEILYAAERGE